MCEDDLHFLAGENDRQALGSFGAFDILDGGELDVENLLVEKEHGVERDVLGGGGDVAVGGKVREVGADFRNAQVSRMAWMVKADSSITQLLDSS
jgi:hypothetical protein